MENTEGKITQEEAEKLVPGWVEFLKITDSKMGDSAAVAFFGDPAATEAAFKSHFSVDLSKYRNFYLEIGITDAPAGNIYGAKVAPILVIQQSRSGKTFTAHVMKHEGFINPETNRAWIKLDEWEQCVQDNLKGELTEKIYKEMKRQEKIQKALDKIEQEGGKILKERKAAEDKKLRKLQQDTEKEAQNGEKKE